MMDASLPADQSGLSDLSTESIDGIGQQYLGPPSPLIDQQPSSLPQTPLQVHANANPTPGPSRISMNAVNKSSAAWTPSPDASSSRSKSISRSIHRSSPRNGNGNESIGSSLGTFDYSNASFSESFLRQAGAHMLAGLDETEMPTPAASSSSSSSSPRYRTSSSPTVTARPIRTADPRTPFTGKSLRTRMAEAGVIDSPASSDGSSPTSSPTTRMIPDSYTRSISFQQEEHVESHSPFPSVQSPRVAYSPSLERVRNGHDGSPLPHDRSTTGDSDWQEGLSMVPEESYVEDVLQLPPSPAVDHAVSQPSFGLDERSSTSILLNKSSKTIANASSSSISAPNQGSASKDDAAPPVSTPSRSESPDNDFASPQATSSEATPAQDSDASQSRDSTPSLPASPRSNLAAPATPSTAPRTVHTPRSFARLRVGTPVRSSPLSRVVNFSPASTGSATSQWQSPVSQRGSVHALASSPAPSSNETNATQAVEQDASFISARDDAHASLARSTQSQANAKEHASHPQTPSSATPLPHITATPSRSWSPATSASFATPASHRQSPAPATPAFSQPQSAARWTSRTDAYSSPAVDFGTPQWSPLPAPVVGKIELIDETAEAKLESNKSIVEPIEGEQEETASSSACSSASAASERKQSGDVSTSSQPAVESSSRKKEVEELSLASTTQQFDSPSAARFSRMQLSHILPPTALVPAELASVPELGLVASAFDSLSHLSDSRISRLVAQLSASTARIEELESALEARESEREELQDVRLTLSQLSVQYDELVQETDEKDATMAELVEKLKVQLHDSGRGREVELERQLQEERRLREVERRDYEVRIQGLMNPAVAASAPLKEDFRSQTTNGDQLHMAIEQAKEQLRSTLEKDFEVRRTMEQRELQVRIEQLERELASAAIYTSDAKGGAAVDHEHDSELQRQVGHLTSELDRRFEELHDLREDFESITQQKDQAEEKVPLLEQELDEARSQAHDHSVSNSSGNSKVYTQLEEELDKARSMLAERDAEISRLQETLSLTNARLASLASEHGALVDQHDHLLQLHTDTSARVAQLESHIYTLETQLRTRTPIKPTDSSSATSAAEALAGTPATDRVSRLERELASLQLELVKMGKANDALQEDNIHFSIALSAKQLELGMVKRNARFALKNAQAHASAATHVGLPRSKNVEAASGGSEEEKRQEVVFPAVPKGEFGGQEDVAQGKENAQGEQVQVNEARLHARQMLAQRRATAEANGHVAHGARRNRPLVAA
ncbi:hypothetical protein EX895_004880 [Sporisorium graminicola]|uniref:Uncharacterized protein n=1 Tax=Sporisorium graminicola TaxID=280036 RepID=A0A4U7KNK4_9BASI|nr:hypothetical protein EX895_004880 [Sporisorium graminicola]TKY86055.1 hypothetical protein EX895_004880 [Sporisorium graminicola]